jgi:hypothetical protein
MAIRSYVDTARDEAQMDATNKLRVTSPQALIDTDFEYGTQVSKWENLSHTNLRPFAYANASEVTGISGIAMTAGSRTVTVTGTGMPVLTVGSPIIVQDTLNPVANGVFAVDSSVTPSATTFAYIARSAATATGTIRDAAKSSITRGTLYTGAAIGGDPTVTAITQGSNTNYIKVVTSVPHGLSIGNEILVTGTAAATSGSPNGTWVVATVENPTTFYFYSSVNAVGAITATGARVYPRPQGAVLHRPYDGGVIFSSNGSSNYETTTRQTRRYFRYQSGKGILFSSGTILKPNFQLESLVYSASTNLVTVTTKDQHNLQPGSTIAVTGANEGIFNGNVTIYGITGYNKFTYTPVSSSTVDVTASGTYYASVITWYGAVNRLGIFDQQNGLFFEFDGTTLYAVRRNSTYQIAGRVDISLSTPNTVTANSGFTTYFSKQLTPGDYIVIRGQSYRVDAIASDTSMTISPSWRGATAVTGANVSKTVDTRMPQSQWNLDKLDGNGPSGYTIDLARMQMFYIDYSWYGAGFIRWGFRTTDGNVTYVHKMQNNNVNFEAYMRSGNLPGRYESSTLPPKTTLAATAGSSDTTITVASTAGFPNSGTAVIRGTSYEHFNYTGVTPTTFTGVTRSQAGANNVTVTTTVGSNIITNASAFTGAQIGQRVTSNTANAVYPDGTFITSISADSKTLTVSQALTGSTSATSITYVSMSATAGTSQSYSVTNPIAVELAYPSFAPTISHWGTSVIMDGRFDDDKSLLFTYGQTTVTNIGPTAGTTATPVTANVAANVDITIPSNINVVVGQSVSAAGGTVTTFTNGCTVTKVNSGTSIQLSAAVNVSGTTLTFTGATSKALFSIRVAPSVDNGKTAAFGDRDLTNRMQLVLRALDIALQGSTFGNLLVTAVLNGVPSSATSWSALTAPTSSLAQIADFAGTANGNITTIPTTSGEVTGGFLVNGTNSVDLSLVRDLGNSILGGGGTAANSGIYPDGPDVLTIVVQNLNTIGAASVVGRLSWTEAQA